MTEHSPARLWTMRAAFAALGLGLMFFQLLPMETLPRRFAGPDLLVAFTFAWAVRRPDYLPVLLVGGLMLMADMLFQRPPGLWAVLMVLATEALKRRAPGLRDQTFAVEWVAVTVTVIAVTLADRLILSILLVPQAPLGLTAIQTVMTVLTYPLIAAVTTYGFGIRKVHPGEVDTAGGRS